ncbi:hypothetical protein TKK_0012496 [Trichogramma kaykai]
MLIMRNSSVLRMDYAVDFQYFKLPGGSIFVKELGILLLIGGSPHTYLFQSDIPFQRLSDKYKIENKRLQEFHGIKYDAGALKQSDIRTILSGELLNARRIYVTSDVVDEYMKNLHYNVVNVGSISSTRRVSCPHHTIPIPPVCAKKNVISISDSLQMSCG